MNKETTVIGGKQLSNFKKILIVICLTAISICVMMVSNSIYGIIYSCILVLLFIVEAIRLDKLTIADYNIYIFLIILYLLVVVIINSITLNNNDDYSFEKLYDLFNLRDGDSISYKIGIIMNRDKCRINGVINNNNILISDISPHSKYDLCPEVIKNTELKFIKKDMDVENVNKCKGGENKTTKLSYCNIKMK